MPVHSKSRAKPHDLDFGCGRRAGGNEPGSFDAELLSDRPREQGTRLAATSKMAAHVSTHDAIVGGSITLTTIVRSRANHNRSTIALAFVASLGLFLLRLQGCESETLLYSEFVAVAALAVAAHGLMGCRRETWPRILRSLNDSIASRWLVSGFVICLPWVSNLAQRNLIGGRGEAGMDIIPAQLLLNAVRGGDIRSKWNAVHCGAVRSARSLVAHGSLLAVY